MAGSGATLHRYSFRLLVKERRLKEELAYQAASFADALHEAEKIAWELVQADPWWLTARATIVVTDDCSNELAVSVSEGAEHYRLARAAVSSAQAGLC